MPSTKQFIPLPDPLGYDDPVLQAKLQIARAIAAKNAHKLGKLLPLTVGAASWQMPQPTPRTTKEAGL